MLQWGLYEAVAQGVDTNDTLQLIRIIPFRELWPVVAGTFAGAGILIGVGGSLPAIRKFYRYEPPCQSGLGGTMKKRWRRTGRVLVALLLAVCSLSVNLSPVLAVTQADIDASRTTPAI